MDRLAASAQLGDIVAVASATANSIHDSPAAWRNPVACLRTTNEPGRPTKARVSALEPEFYQLISQGKFNRPKQVLPLKARRRQF
jgi:hypothetical protein